MGRSPALGASLEGCSEMGGVSLVWSQCPAIVLELWLSPIAECDTAECDTVAVALDSKPHLKEDHQLTAPLAALPQETIVRLLYSLASRREVSRYLQIFSSATHFAVLKVGGAILTHDLESLTLSLNFLHRVGLYPVVVHGMGDKLNAILEADGIVPDYIDGVSSFPATTSAQL